jgi:hypothetical protein
MLEDVPVEEEERPVITISPDMYHLDGTWSSRYLT